MVRHIPWTALAAVETSVCDPIERIEECALENQADICCFFIVETDSPDKICESRVGVQRIKKR